MTNETKMVASNLNPRWAEELGGLDCEEAEHLDEGPVARGRMTRGDRGRAGYFTKWEIRPIHPVARWNAEDFAAYAPIS